MIPIHPAPLQAIPARVADDYLKPGLLNLTALPPLSLYVHRSEEHTSELQSH